MNAKNEKLAWTIAIVLAILLAVSVYFWLNAKKSLDTVLEQGRQNITADRDQIRIDCAKTDAAGKLACKQDLQNLADTLKEFSKDVASAPQPAATTTTGAGVTTH